MIVVHNAFDSLVISQGEPGFIPWSILHGGKRILLGTDCILMPLYPLIPWVGVLAAGYAFGTILIKPSLERSRALQRMALGLIAAFVVLRLGNLYGDAQVWNRELGWDRSWMSFLNCSKYPPSLQYLLMTLGPGIGLLWWFARLGDRVPGVLVHFGRVPMFYYIVHLYLIHALSGVVNSLFGTAEGARFIWKNDPFFGAPEGFGFPLWVTPVMWVVVVAMLYWPCRWFARIKHEHRGKAWRRLI
jgi:uncharacterized membrane protein